MVQVVTGQGGPGGQGGPAGPVGQGCHACVLLTCESRAETAIKHIIES